MTFDSSEKKLNEQWGAFAAWIRRNPKTGFWTALGAGVIIGITVVRWFS